MLGVVGLVEPGEKPGVTEGFEAVEAISITRLDVDGAMFAPVEGRLDRGGLGGGSAGADHADHREWDCRSHGQEIVAGRTGMPVTQGLRCPTTRSTTSNTYRPP